MFAIEIEFKDGAGDREVILVRRPLVIIGARESAHVVIEDFDSSEQLILVRHLGRRFRTALTREPLTEVGEDSLQFVEHEGEAIVEVASVALRIIALDMDLAVRSGEAADRAAVRVLREATSASHPLFPALVMKAGATVVFSFAPEVPVLVGRGRDCPFRIDSTFISATHARFGFENGRFWVEDLGSTNGTYRNGGRIAGRTALDPSEQVILGMDLTVAGIVSADQIVKAASWSAPSGDGAATYPVLISNSDAVRPNRVALVPGVPIHVGRDPSSELWIGAPHVSRKHAIVQLESDGTVRVTNRSSNGLGYGEGVLQAEESLDLSGQPVEFDFGGGVTVSLCFSHADEVTYLEGRGAAREGGARRNSQGLALVEDAASNGEEEGASEFQRRVRRRRAVERDDTSEGTEIGLEGPLRTGGNLVSRLRGVLGRRFSGR